MADSDQSTPAPILVGTARWTIPFDTPADRIVQREGSLARYLRHLACSEINSCFYRHHRPATYARWAASTPDGFRFSAKVPKTITHEARLDLGPSLPVLERFLSELAHLEFKLGPLLVQLPPSLQFDSRVAEDFFSALRQRWHGGVACEPRHVSWFSPAPEPLFEQHRIARVAADPALVPVAGEPGGWAGLVYVRLHGSPKMYDSRYEPAYVRDLATRLQACAGGPAEQVWCIFDNTARGEGLHNALELQGLLDGRDPHQSPS